MHLKQFLVICLVSIFATQSTIASEKPDACTDLARDDDTLLVFSTLGGGLTAIDPITSELRWSIADEPAINVPSQTDFPAPQYLPDPRDGSLYQMGDMGSLKKLPYTIPELVASAPCRSSDGILYSGRKSDTWFLIDPKTGKREKVFGFGAPSESDEAIGWATSRAVYLGRTQYTVLMYDSVSQNKDTKPWNVTFYDYSSHSMAPEISQEYEWLHLTASGSGSTATLDRSRGTLLWEKDLSSPVVAVFLLGPDGLLSVPFTTVSDDALKNVVDFAKEGHKSDIKLFQTLYVGENSQGGLYAIPSLVDKHTATISSDPPIKLLEGPNDRHNNIYYLNKLIENNRVDQKNVILLGHYQMPKTEPDFKISLSSGQLPSTKKSNELSTARLVDYNVLHLNKDGHDKLVIPPETSSIGIQTDGDVAKGLNSTRKNPKEFIAQVYVKSKSWLSDQESQILKVLLIILMGMVISMFFYMRTTVKELRLSQSGSHPMMGSKAGGADGKFHELEDLGNGDLRVGKISFNSNDILGKGCEGTFVFKGSFEKRKVAVKRLLPECFTLADREVSLLRESDAHENVVRYFCTEQDRQFRYIAVELCAATLQDYTEGVMSGELQLLISVRDVLRQATAGLVHLHSLHIVHRDIKPQNVLLSIPDATRSVRAMISDFGLCKKLNIGKASFSRRSGITGTEGWIAPEMLKGQRTTTSVDIFSLGCVFYYVMSGGMHAFGDTVKRQANILSHEFDLQHLLTDTATSIEILAAQLIADMIDGDHDKRPTAKAVVNHPVFWREEKILSFLQDVSDRVEKSDYATQPLKTLEKNAKLIVRGDWNLHLDATITADLRKYRGYQGESVRDLLRALRNKKHHYHELDVAAQKALGSIPGSFTRYWIERYPQLLSHSYHALELCAGENAFNDYYNDDFKFTKPDYFHAVDTDDYQPPDFVRSKESPKKFVKKETPKDIDSNKRSICTKPDGFVKQNRKGAYNFHRAVGEVVVGEGAATLNGTASPNDGAGSYYRKPNNNMRKRSNAQENNVVWTLNQPDD